MTAITPRIRLPWASARVPLAVVVGLVLAVAAVVTVAFLTIGPAPAQSTPTHSLPLHSVSDSCSGVMPGNPC